MDVHRRWVIGTLAAMSVVAMVGCSSDTGAGSSGAAPPLSVDAGNGDAANSATAQTDAQNQANISVASSIAASIAGSSVAPDSGAPDTAVDVAMGNQGTNQGTNQGIGQSTGGAAGTGGTQSTRVPGATSTAMTATSYAQIVVANLREMPAGGAPTMSNLRQVAQLVKPPATVQGVVDTNGDGIDDDGRLSITMSGRTSCVSHAGDAWSSADGACPGG